MKFGFESTVKLHWLSVLLASVLVEVRPDPGKNWFSNDMLTLPQAFGTDVNSPCCSEVTYGRGFGEWCVTIARMPATTTQTAIATPHQR
jgi:hypothetical protein